ncbi:MAG: DUF1343 domain-containing protein [Acidobacteriota bacterium]
MLEPRVSLGIDELLRDDCRILAGRRVGLLVHPASVDSRLRSTVDVLAGHPRVSLRALFGPQHGLWGETQDNMIEWSDFEDPARRLPVYSLYGETRKPTPRMLEDLDTLVVDLQDVGARYYTFIWTLALVMEAAGELGVEVVVLDRPNPLNGTALEGPVLDPGYSSFVGLLPIPVRHGMTIAELALLFRHHFGIECELHVVPMRGWRREYYWDDTGLAWVPPSPNMPYPGTALVYPGSCLFEATNVSEGRGTTLPFELLGAPWIEPERFAAELNARKLPGAYFRAVRFQPTFHKWCGHVIGGIHLHVTDRQAFRPWRTGLHLLEAFRRYGGDEFAWLPPPYEYEYEKMPIDILAGTPQVRQTLDSGGAAADLAEVLEANLDEFAQLRGKYLLY